MRTCCGGFGASWIALVGGVGMRLGRRDPDQLRVGDALDFWRVEEVRRPTLLRLRAEMKVPAGRGSNTR